MNRLFASFVFLVSVNVWSADTLTTPHVYSNNFQNLKIRTYKAMKECKFLLSNIPAIIDSANSRFERRNWSPQFIKERLEIAKKVSERSEYLTIHDTKTNPDLKPEDNLGTLGVTWARYSKDDLQPNEKLGLEDTLNQLLDRPVGENGKGIIFEFRTFSMDKERGDEAFPQLLLGGLEIVFKYLKKFPELYDKPIIYLYGDSVSLRLYRLPKFGFEKVTSLKPVIHDGTKWWTMAISPKDLEARLFQLKGDRDVEGLNQDHPIVNKAGQAYQAPAKSEIRFDNEGFAEALRTSQSIELKSGIFAAKGAYSYWDDDGNLIYVDNLAKSAFFANENQSVPAGSLVEMDAQGHLLSVDFSEDTLIKKFNFWAKAGRKFYWMTKESLVEDSMTAKPYEVAPGIVASKDSLVWWHWGRGQQVPFNIMSLNTDTELLPGLWAAKGSEVKWELSSSRRKLTKIEYIRKLARPYKISPRKWAQAGDGLLFENGKPVEAVKWSK